MVMTNLIYLSQKMTEIQNYQTMQLWQLSLESCSGYMRYYLKGEECIFLSSQWYWFISKIGFHGILDFDEICSSP